jgi:hypothetical protein
MNGQEMSGMMMMLWTLTGYSPPTPPCARIVTIREPEQPRKPRTPGITPMRLDYARQVASETIRKAHRERATFYIIQDALGTLYTLHCDDPLVCQFVLESRARYCVLERVSATCRTDEVARSMLAQRRLFLRRLSAKRKAEGSTPHD